MKKAWRKFEEHITPIMVVTAFLLGVIYTAIIIVLSIQGVMVPDTLTDKFFDVIVGELLSLAFIKGTKHISTHFGRRGSRIAEAEELNEMED